MEILVGSILFRGVVLSSGLLAIGLVWHWITTGRLELEYSLAPTNFSEFFLADVRRLFSNALESRSLVDLGLAVLIVTPYERVFASIVYFALVEPD